MGFGTSPQRHGVVASPYLVERGLLDQSLETPMHTIAECIRCPEEGVVPQRMFEGVEP